MRIIFIVTSDFFQNCLNVVLNLSSLNIESQFNFKRYASVMGPLPRQT